MDQIASLWLVWLIATIVCYAYVGYNQVRRMKGMFGSAKKGDVDGAFGGFFSGLGPLVAAGLIGSVTGILFLVAVIIHVAGGR